MRRRPGQRLHQRRGIPTAEVQAEAGTARLSPSETALLHGDRFAGAAGRLRSKEALRTSDEKVSTDHPVEVALAALVLGGGLRGRRGTASA